MRNKNKLHRWESIEYYKAEAKFYANLLKYQINFCPIPPFI